MFENIKLVLASGSPRRKQLLEQAEVAFVVKTIPVQEDYPESLLPEDVPVYLAHKKAIAARQFCEEDECILAADTIVLLQDKILGKPADKAEAVNMLSRLSGKRHKVITGVCLLMGTKKKSFSVSTKVQFTKLSGEQIRHYVDQYEPLDKAGAYAIQEWIGLTGIERIEGDYFNVVGLPVATVLKEIEKLINE